MNRAYTLTIGGMLVSGLLILASCERTAETPPQKPSDVSPAAAASKARGSTNLDAVSYVGGGSTTSAPSGALPPNHPPIDAPRRAAPPAAAAGKLKYDAPPTWKSEPPKSSMRLAQYALPRAEGDTEDGLLTLTNVGGPVEANLARWRGFFTTEAGAAVADSAVKRESFEANGLRVTMIDTSGRYTDQMSRGDASPTSVEFRLLGAVVETQAGNWYFKATGPAATMAAHRDAFVAMLRTAKME